MIHPGFRKPFELHAWGIAIASPLPLSFVRQAVVVFYTADDRPLRRVSWIGDGPPFTSIGRAVLGVAHCSQFAGNLPDRTTALAVAGLLLVLGLVARAARNHRQFRAWSLGFGIVYLLRQRASFLSAVEQVLGIVD
jgi:hypothetical protein